jgi:hypothetical protein
MSERQVLESFRRHYLACCAALRANDHSVAARERAASDALYAVYCELVRERMSAQKSR